MLTHAPHSFPRDPYTPWPRVVTCCFGVTYDKFGLCPDFSNTGQERSKASVQVDNNSAQQQTSSHSACIDKYAWTRHDNANES